MRCIIRKIYLYRYSTKNIKVTTNFSSYFCFLFYKYYTFFSYLSNSNNSFKKQMIIFSSIINKATLINARFLIIDDLSNKSYFNAYNSFNYPNLIFFFKYLLFVYNRSKNKRLFLLYLSKLIFSKKIIFLIFLNESFFLKNLTLFKKLKNPKLGFISNKENYILLDYAVYTTSKLFINQHFFFIFLYSIIKNSKITKLRIKNTIYLNKL